MIVAIGLSGCVNTAECDEYVGCVDGAICFQSKCKPVCSGDDECDEGQRCIPCIEEHEEGVDDRCLGLDEMACVSDDAA